MDTHIIILVESVRNIKFLKQTWQIFINLSKIAIFWGTSSCDIFYMW